MDLLYSHLHWATEEAPACVLASPGSLHNSIQTTAAFWKMNISEAGPIPFQISIRNERVALLLRFVLEQPTQTKKPESKS
jgi:hypothetical protein